MSDPRIEEALSPRTSSARLRELSQEGSLASYVAQNPAAPPRLLEDLARVAVSATRRAVVQNPNTPPNTLLSMAAEFPGEFLENPILPLVGLAQPRFFDHLPDLALKALLSHASTPGDILDRLGEHPAWGARAALAGTEEVAPFVLARLLCDPHAAVRKAAALHPSVPQNLLSLLLRAGTNLVDATPADTTLTASQIEHLASLGGFARALAAAHPSASASLLERLAEDPKPAVQQGLAKNPSTPISLLEALARSPHPETRGGVAQNPSAPRALLAKLAQDPDDEVRCELSKNSALPRDIYEAAMKQGRYFGARASRDTQTAPHILTWLSQESNEDLVDEVARNASAPLPVLLHLAQTAPEPLLHMMARTRTMPAPVLSILLVHKSSRVRSAAAYHENTPKDLRDELIRAGSSPDMAHLAEPDPDFPPARLAEFADGGFYSRFIAAAHPKTPLEHLSRLALNEEPEIRWSITQNPNVPLELLEKLVVDETPWVREGVGQSAISTTQIIARLLADQARAVRQTAATHPKAPKDLWRLLCRGGVRADLAQFAPAAPDLSADELETLAKSATFGRFLAAQHPNLPANLLEALATDPQPLVRGGAALNPNISPLLLSRLIQDSVPSVRGWCATRPNIREEKLLDLVGDPEEEVRYRVLNRPKLSNNILEALSQDKSANIRRRVAERLDPSDSEQATLLHKLTDDDELTVRQEAITHLQDQTKLEELANDWHDLIRAEVARNANITPKLLERLSNDLEPLVRAAVVSNPKIELPLLERLVAPTLAQQPFSGPEALLLQGAAENPTTPQQLIEQLAVAVSPFVRASIARRPNLPTSFLEKLSDDEVFEVRAGVARNSSTPIELLSKLSQDLSPDVRAAVASNPNLTLEILQKLATDPISEVRWAARGQTRLWESLLQHNAEAPLNPLMN